VTQVERHSIEVPTAEGRLAAYAVRPIAKPARATAVFLHGRMFPSVPDFDLQVAGEAGSFSFMEHLARRGIDCWCFDHRGFGASWKPPEGSLFDAHVRAQDLLAVLPAVQRHSSAPLTLVGLSLGCSAVAAAMKKHPRLSRRVVLLGPARWAGFGTLQARWTRLRSMMKAGAKKSRYITADFAGLEKRLWVGEEARVSRAAFVAFVQAAIDANPDGPKDRVAALVSEVIPYADRPVFRVPVLAIRGSDDDLATEADMEAVRRFIDPSLLTVETFPGRKHDLHLYNEHEDVFESIASFVLADN
jgi:pimeloyl-ACP methyl ester carboxylesterase